LTVVLFRRTGRGGVSTILRSILAAGAIAVAWFNAKWGEVGLVDQGCRLWFDLLSGGEVFTVRIMQANLDGSSPELLYELPLNENAIAPDYDPGTGALYWSGYDNALGPVIRRFTRERGCEIVVIEDSSGAKYLRVDAAGGMIYWTAEDKIRRAGLDGAGAETIVDLPSDNVIEFLDIDSSAGKVYWAENSTPQRIARANLDGSGIETVVSVSRELFSGLAVDEVGSKLYWFRPEVSGLVTLNRANLDGSSVEELLSFFSFTGHPLVIDSGGGRLYWADMYGLRRAGLDGTDPQFITSTFPPQFQLTLDPLGDGLRPFSCSGDPVPALSPTGAVVLAALMLVTGTLVRQCHRHGGSVPVRDS
jgi:hypothetical protein